MLIKDHKIGSKLYLISDLHFGGDGSLQICDFTDEIIAFLKELENESPDTELMLVGDTFGFWELTTLQGVAKLEEIISYHKAIFDQFRATGEKIKITMMVGNHDYDLACDPAFGVKLLEYNILLDTSIAVTRQFGSRRIWIEHGQQIDSYNASPDYGNPFAVPVGFYITQQAVAGASKYSVFGTSDWLKDIRSVDIRQLPDWIISNYFYREMNMVLRILLLPFLVLLTVTAVALAAEALRIAGIFDANILLNNFLITYLGVFGNAIRLVIGVSMVFWFFIFVVSIPLIFIFRDVKRTLERMQILPEETKDTPIYVPTAGYEEHAERIFAEHKDVAAYIFGHTHDAFLKQKDGRLIINTGTWLKLLQRIPVILGYLPAVYYPTFRLNYFMIKNNDDDKISVEYVVIPKEPKQELTLLQRLFMIGRKPTVNDQIPSKIAF